MLGSQSGRTAFWRSWLFAPPLEGFRALSVSIAAVAIPTLIQLTLPNGTDRFECATFCPFVLAAAVLAGWRFAVPVAIVSAVACYLLPGMAEGTSELIGLFAFLAYCFATIGIVALARWMARQSLKDAGADERSGGIVFSADDGDAWASWYGTDPPVRLGPTTEVARMMEDFLAQVELGKRLLDRNRRTFLNPDRGRSPDLR